MIHRVLRTCPHHPPSFLSVNLNPVEAGFHDNEASSGGFKPQPRGWYPLLIERAATGLASLVQGVDPRARLALLPGDDPAWEISLGEEPAEETLAVQVARGTVLYRTELESHIQLLELQA